MRKFSVFLASLVMTSLLVAGTAAGGHEWCAEDPVFQVLGANFRITTSVNAPASAISRITYDVTLPSDAEGATAFHFPQGRFLPTTVNVTYAGNSGASFPVTVRVTVTSSTAAAVVVDLTGPDVTAARETGDTSSATVLVFNATAK